MKSILSFLVLAALWPMKAMANPACVVCTVAIGASLEVARKLGVSDAVVGLWTGAEFLRPGFFTDGAGIVNGWFFVRGAIGLYAEGHRFFLYGRIFVFGLSRCRRLCLFAETICPDEGTQQQPCAFSV